MALVEETTGDLLDLALARGIDLGVETAAAEVLGSRWMLREMLANLIENAILYTPPGGRVTVRCGGGVDPFVAVEDDGPGIAPAERERIFERFYRIEGSGGEGSGLGLAIVREVAERHGADIAVDSAAHGRGTCIRVDFPAPRQTPLSGN